MNIINNILLFTAYKYMILSIEWLKEHLKTTKSAEEICNKLNEIGLEVENTLPNKSTFEKIIVAEIQECFF